MVETKLQYNPYLMETYVEFNGKRPKINSQVEKYIGKELQAWIKKLPMIFYDEMNGFDFDLKFSGTELEFKDLQEVLKIQKISEEMVKLTHVNVLESREDKIKRIGNLLNWIENNPNRKFDYPCFYNDNVELITEQYRYVILYSNYNIETSLDNLGVHIENIMDINELDNTDLNYTPILICIDNKTLEDLQINLEKLLLRKDINESQLFFSIDKNLNKNVIERIILDLGIRKPQVIDKIDDNKVLKYLQIYPMTNYISKMIKLFQNKYNELNEELAQVSKFLASKNREIHGQIDTLDESINILKVAKEKINDMDELDYYSLYQFVIDDFIKNISKWRLKKSKSYEYEEAIIYARELAKKSIESGNEFIKIIYEQEERIAADIFNQYKEIYIEANHQADYCPKISLAIKTEKPIFQDYTSKFMEMKEEEWVTPSKNLIAQLFNQDEPEDEPYLRFMWQIDKWRQYVKEEMLPILDNVIAKSISRLKNYSDELITDYTFKLDEMIDSELKQKEGLIEKLSNEERLLEIDIEWLRNLEEQISKIERA